MTYPISFISEEHGVVKNVLKNVLTEMRIGEVATKIGCCKMALTTVLVDFFFKNTQKLYILR